MKKKVFIYAYTRNNLGDDLFIKILCERYLDAKFYILSDRNSSRAISEISNLTIFYRIPWVDGILRKLGLNISLNTFIQKFISLFCDASVNIGGSIFIQNDNWQNKAKLYSKRILKSKPFYIIGSNFGPYNCKEYYLKYKDIFSRVTDICFREKYSYELFKTLPNVRIASDVVFTLSKKFSCDDSLGDYAVISIINLSNREKLKLYEDEYYKKIVQICKELIQERIPIVFMGFCEDEGDTEAIRKVMLHFNDDEINYIKVEIYKDDIDSLLNIIANSKFVIATRFHAMILGWVYGKIVFPIIYSNKSMNVINDTGFNVMFSKIQEIDHIDPKEIINYLLQSEPVKIEKQIKSAHNQFKMLDDLLNSL